MKWEAVEYGNPCSRKTKGNSRKMVEYIRLHLKGRPKNNLLQSFHKPKKALISFS